jgi:hypothetical protein
VAAPRESRRSDAGRLILAGAVAAPAVFAFDARGHGGLGLEWLAVPFLIFVGAVIATFIVHLAMGEAPLGLRFLQAIGWAAADVGLALSSGWVLFFLTDKLQLAGPRGTETWKMVVWAAPVVAWLLPVYLFVRQSRRRG